MKGKKYDTGKPRWNLLPWVQVAEVVQVITYGAAKYADENWKKVVSAPGGKARYTAACIRHLYAWMRGEWLDKESKLPHLAHAVCCLLFCMWQDMKK
jgi:hypothetical protein